MIEFVFALTHDDVTVGDALQILPRLRSSGLGFVAINDVGLSTEVLTDIAFAAHDIGIEVMLEIASSGQVREARSLRAALSIGADWVLGGRHPHQGAEILANSTVRYCPAAGRVEGHPRELHGEIDDIAAHAAELTAMPGVHGVELLAHRHARADPVALTRAVAAASDGPVIVSGSIDALDQIGELEAAGAWGFTIGTAIFEGRLPGAPTIAGQIGRVLDLVDRVAT